MSRVKLSSISTTDEEDSHSNSNGGGAVATSPPHAAADTTSENTASRTDKEIACAGRRMCRLVRLGQCSSSADAEEHRVARIGYGDRVAIGIERGDPTVLIECALLLICGARNCTTTETAPDLCYEFSILIALPVERNAYGCQGKHVPFPRDRLSAIAKAENS